MRLLVLETATDACSVALAMDGRVITRHSTRPRVHASRLLGMIDECLTEGHLRPPDLQALAFGRGPGSFTGVRIATGVTQGLAFGLDCRVIPLSTLAGFAATASRLHDAHRVAVCVDARMGECYWGAFQITGNGIAVPVGDECLAGPGDLPPPDGDGWLAVGSGWRAYPELGNRMARYIDSVAEDILPAASDLVATAEAALADGASVPVEETMPIYLRERVAWRT